MAYAEPQHDEVDDVPLLDGSQHEERVHGLVQELCAVVEHDALGPADEADAQEQKLADEPDEQVQKLVDEPDEQVQKLVDALVVIEGVPVASVDVPVVIEDVPAALYFVYYSEMILHFGCYYCENRFSFPFPDVRPDDHRHVER